MNHLVFTHGDPSEPSSCGRPVRTSGAPPRATWTCLVHGLLAASGSPVFATVVDQPGCNARRQRQEDAVVDSTRMMREMFQDMREGMRVILEEMRQEAFPVMTVNESRLERGLASSSGTQANDAVLASLAGLRVSEALEVLRNTESRLEARQIILSGEPPLVERLRERTDDAIRREVAPGHCTVFSSVTWQPCTLEEGHTQWSADRFHKYEPPEATGTFESEPHVTFEEPSNVRFPRRRPE